MKYEKETSLRKRDRRWYEDACGTAFALELVGERWSLLIIRELLFGPRRFSELRTSLRGITAKVLTERLEGLEAAGVLIRRKLPPPAAVQVYELTDWGAQCERPIQELGRWASRSPDHDRTLPLSAAGLMSSLRTMFSASQAGGFEGGIGLELGDEAFAVQIADGRIHIRRGEVTGTNVVMRSTPEVLAAVIYGGLSLHHAERDGSVSVAGERSIAERFLRLFPLA